MKLAELQKVSKSAVPASQGAVTPEPVASPAPLEPQSVIPGQMTVDECIAEVPQGITTVTPSGVEIQHEWAPRRLYRLNGQEAPSVTTVLGVLDKSGPLTWWGQGVGVEGALSLVESGHLYVGGSPETSYVYRASDGLRATKDGIVALLTEHKLTVNHVKDKAADRGVNVHNALELWVAERDIPAAGEWPATEYPYVQGLADFLIAIDSAAKDVQAELMVGSLQHHYAGRFDLVLEIKKPIEVTTRVYPKKAPRLEEIPAGRWIIDLKTSKNCYPTHALQLAAYKAAASECGYGEADYTAVLHVTSDGRYELRRTQATLDDFLAVLSTYQTMENGTWFV